MDLAAVMPSLIWTELGRTFVPFRFGGEADNILYDANEEQKARYLLPTIEGERSLLRDHRAGRRLRRRATSAPSRRRDGDDWVINGEKTFITGGNDADFAIVVAVTDPEKGADGGVTAFLVDRDMGWTSEPIQTMGEGGPASLVFDDVRVPHSRSSARSARASSWRCSGSARAAT